MKPKDKEIAGLIHLLNIIPLWGVLFNGIIWYLVREKNEDLVFNALQAIFFHSIFLALFIIGCGIHLFCLPIKFIVEQIGVLFIAINWSVIVICWVGYICTCLYGSYKKFNGEDFEYPFVGAKLRKSIRGEE